MALRIPHLWGFLRLVVEILAILAIAILLVSGLMVAEREIKHLSCTEEIAGYVTSVYNSISFREATPDIPIWKANFCNVTSFINTHVELPVSTYVDTTPETAVLISGSTLVGLIGLQLLKYLWMLLCVAFHAFKWVIFKRRRNHRQPAETRQQHIEIDEEHVSQSSTDVSVDDDDDEGEEKEDEEKEEEEEEEEVDEEQLSQSSTDDESDHDQIKGETSYTGISEQEEAEVPTIEKQGHGRSLVDEEVKVIVGGDGSEKIEVKAEVKAEVKVDVKTQRDDKATQMDVEQQQNPLTENHLLRHSRDSTRLFLSGPARDVKKFLSDKRIIRSLAKECQSSIAGYALSTRPIVNAVQPLDSDVLLTMASEKQTPQSRMGIVCAGQTGDESHHLTKADAPQQRAELAKETSYDTMVTTATVAGGLAMHTDVKSGNVTREDVAKKMSVMHDDIQQIDFATNDLRVSIANYHHQLRDKSNVIKATQAQISRDQASVDFANPTSTPDSELIVQSDAMIVDFEQIQSEAEFRKQNEHLNLTAKQGLVAEIPYNEQRNMISGTLIQNASGEQTEPKNHVTPFDNTLKQLQLEQEDLSSKIGDEEMVNESELKKLPAQSQEAESITRTSDDSQGRDTSYDAERVTHSSTHSVINTVDDLAEIIILLTSELATGTLTRAAFAEKMSLMHDDIKKKDVSMRALQTAIVRQQHRLHGKKHANRPIKSQVPEDQSRRKVINQSPASASSSTPALQSDSRIVEHEQIQSGAEFAKRKEQMTHTDKHSLVVEIPCNERINVISGILIEKGGGEMAEPKKQVTSLDNNLKQLQLEHQDVHNKIKDWEMWNERKLNKSPAQSVESEHIIEMSDRQGSDTSYDVEQMRPDSASQTGTLSENSEQPQIQDQKTFSKDVSAMYQDMAPPGRDVEDREKSSVHSHDDACISSQELTSKVSNAASSHDRQSGSSPLDQSIEFPEATTQKDGPDIASCDVINGRESPSPPVNASNGLSMINKVDDATATYDILKNRGKSPSPSAIDTNDFVKATIHDHNVGVCLYNILNDRAKSPSAQCNTNECIKAAPREKNVGSYDVLRDQRRSKSPVTEDKFEFSKISSVNDSDAAATYDVLKDRGKSQSPPFNGVHTFVKAAAHEYDARIGSCDILKNWESTRSSVIEDCNEFSMTRDATATYDVLKDRGKSQSPLYDETDGSPKMVYIPSCGRVKYQRRSRSSSPNIFSNKRSYMAKLPALQNISDSSADVPFSDPSMELLDYTRSNIAYEINMICTGGKGLSPPSVAKHSHADAYHISDSSTLNDKHMAWRSTSHDNLTIRGNDKSCFTPAKRHGPVRSQSHPVVDRSQRQPIVDRSQFERSQAHPIVGRSQLHLVVDTSQPHLFADANVLHSTQPDKPIQGTVKNRILSFQTMSDGSDPIRSLSPHRMHIVEPSVMKGSDLPSYGSVRKKLNALKRMSEFQQAAKPELLPVDDMKTSFAKALASFTGGDISEPGASKESQISCDHYMQAASTIRPANVVNTSVESSQIPVTKSITESTLRHRRNTNNKVKSAVRMLESQHPVSSTNTNQSVYNIDHDAIAGNSWSRDKVKTESRTSGAGGENIGRSYLSHLAESKELSEQTTTTNTSSGNMAGMIQTTPENISSFSHPSYHAMSSIDEVSGAVRYIPQMSSTTMPSLKRHDKANSSTREIETATFRPISKEGDPISSSIAESSVSEQMFSDMDAGLVTGTTACNSINDAPLSVTPERDKYDMNTLVRPFQSSEMGNDGLRHPSCEKEFDTITMTLCNDAKGTEDVFDNHIDKPIVPPIEMLNRELEKEYPSLATCTSMKKEDSERTEIPSGETMRGYPHHKVSVIERRIATEALTPTYMPSHVHSPFTEAMTTSFTSCDTPDANDRLFRHSKPYFDGTIKSTMRTQSPVSMFIASVTSRKVHHDMDPASIDRRGKGIDGIPQATQARKPDHILSSSNNILKSTGYGVSTVTRRRQIRSDVAITSEGEHASTQIAKPPTHEQTPVLKRIQVFSNDPGTGKERDCLIVSDVEKYVKQGRHSPSENAMACANYTLHRSKTNPDTKTSLMNIFKNNRSDTRHKTAPVQGSSLLDNSESVKDRVLSIEKEDYMAFSAAARTIRTMPTDNEERPKKINRAIPQSREVRMELNCLRHAKQVKHVSWDILMRKMHISRHHETKERMSEQQQNDVASELDQLRNKKKMSDHITDDKPPEHHHEPPDIDDHGDDDDLPAEDSVCTRQSHIQHAEPVPEQDTRTINKYLSGIGEYTSHTNNDDIPADDEVVVKDDHDGIEALDISVASCPVNDDPERVDDYNRAAMHHEATILEGVQLPAADNQCDISYEDLGIVNHERSLIEDDQGDAINGASNLDDDSQCVSISTQQASIPTEQSVIDDGGPLSSDECTIPNTHSVKEHGELPTESDGGAISKADSFIVGDEYDPWVILKEPALTNNHAAQYTETLDTTFSELPSTRDAGLFN